MYLYLYTSPTCEAIDSSRAFVNGHVYIRSSASGTEHKQGRSSVMYMMYDDGARVARKSLRVSNGVCCIEYFVECTPQGCINIKCKVHVMCGKYALRSAGVGSHVHALDTSSASSRQSRSSSVIHFLPFATTALPPASYYLLKCCTSGSQAKGSYLQCVSHVTGRAICKYYTIFKPLRSNTNGRRPLAPPTTQQAGATSAPRIKAHRRTHTFMVPASRLIVSASSSALASRPSPGVTRKRDFLHIHSCSWAHATKLSMAAVATSTRGDSISVADITS